MRLLGIFLGIFLLLLIIALVCAFIGAISGIEVFNLSSIVVLWILVVVIFVTLLYFAIDMIIHGGK